MKHLVWLTSIFSLALMASCSSCDSQKQEMPKDTMEQTEKAPMRCPDDEDDSDSSNGCSSSDDDNSCSSASHNAAPKVAVKKETVKEPVVQKVEAPAVKEIAKESASADKSEAQN